MGKTILFVWVMAPLMAFAGEGQLLDRMNTLLREVGPTYPQHTLADARALVYTCFISPKPCVTGGYWAAGRSARLVAQELHHRTSRQQVRARELLAQYETLMQGTKMSARDRLFAEMNDLLGEYDDKSAFGRDPQEARALIERCFISKQCTSYVDYGIFSSRNFRPNARQVQRAIQLVNRYDQIY